MLIIGGRQFFQLENGQKGGTLHYKHLHFDVREYYVMMMQ